MVREISEVPAQCEVGGANLELCGDAKDWDGKLRDMAHEIRCRVREVEGGPAPGAVPVPDEEDVPLGQDIRDSDRIARRLADHHPDPEGASDLPAARRVHRRRAEGRS
jgi:hypothetical protein